MKKLLILLLLITVLALTVAACSATTPAPSAPTPEMAPTAEATESEGVQPPAMPAGNLVGSWQWTSFSDPVNGPSDIADPENYVLTFEDGGAVTVKADCNNAQGSYTVDGSSISIQLGPSTMAYCGDESRSDDFLKYLSFAAKYHFDGGKLLVDLKADGGTMTFVSATAEISNALSPETVAALDGLLQQFVYTEGAIPVNAAPGIILLVDMPQGRYLKAAGVADMDANTPMKTDDILEIGSITKSFVIVLLLQLQEEGKLSLDDPLSKHLPEWAEKIPNGDQMTLRHFATHTSGIWDYGDPLLEASAKDPKLLRKGYAPEELVQYALDNGAPEFKPGEEGKWAYSNTGYVLLGMVIEKVSGQSLESLFQERIFDPLGMASASLVNDVPTPDQVTTRGYWWPLVDENNLDNLVYKDRVDVTDWNASQGWAAGALAMTAEDLATYAHALSAGKFFQDPATQQLMTDFKQYSEDSVTAAMFPYGLGLMDFSKATLPDYWGHGGQTPGFQSLLFVNSETGVISVGLTNSGTFESLNLLTIITDILGE